MLLFDRPIRHPDVILQHDMEIGVLERHLESEYAEFAAKYAAGTFSLLCMGVAVHS